MAPGKRGKQASSQSGPSKVSLAVRESNPSSLASFAKCFPSITHMDDCIGIADEMVPVRFRGKQLNLDTGRTLLSWIPSHESPSKGQLTLQEGAKQTTVAAFMKQIPLINGYNWLRDKERPTQPFFWPFQSDTCLQPYNQAYVDAVASFLAWKTAGAVRSPHMCEFYGCFRGVAKTFLYNLEDDFEDVRFTHWFWEGFVNDEFSLRIVERSTGRRLTKEEIMEAFKPDNEFLNDDEDDNVSIASASEDESDSSSIGAESVSSLEASTPLERNQQGFPSSNPIVSLSKAMSTASSIRTASDSDSVNSFTDEYTIHAECHGMPIVAIFLQEMDGTMDELIEMPEYCPIQTPDQESRWLAWLFQVCAACTQLQSVLHLTHNDLHTDNVMFKRTTQEHLLYKDSAGTIWKIPTFGYIFTIIDYGRSIYTVSGYTMISNDYDDGDACGMYNFGPIEDETEPKIHPNRSFDLCRLACSLLRGLYPLNPPGKEHGMILTKEGDWEVRETSQVVFNLLWGWLKSKDGSNCLETHTGEERHPGFDLYSFIAANVHSAVPRDQIGKAMFRRFVQTGAPSTTHMYINIPS